MHNVQYHLMQIHEKVWVKSETNPVILYDGACLFCSHSLKWILQRDKQEVFWFGSLQNNENITQGDPDTVILVQDRLVYSKSTAAIKILQNLGGFYSVCASITMMIPLCIRDWVYDWIAKYRHIWKRNTQACERLVSQWENRKI